MKQVLMFALLYGWLLPLFGQKHTISGYVGDKRSQEKLIGAVVYDTRTKAAASTNAYGFFSLTLPADSVRLVVSYIGFATQTRSFLLDADRAMNIDLTPNNELAEVEVVVEHSDRIEQRTAMSTINIPIEQLKKVPALLGEVDVLKVLQLMPGVKNGGEGSTGLYVRGGGPDQNLILLDGAPVYNASHLFGFFSTFNADAIKNVDLIKGGFPARYGGRLSSVIDINMKEGNMRRYNVEGSIGLVAARLMVEGPIWKDRTSFIVTARRTYLDQLTRPLIRAISRGEGDGGYYFYDLNAKVNHKISDRDRVFLSMYNGLDNFYFKSGSAMGSGTSFGGYLKWGNLLGALRWNHLFNSRLFCNTSVLYTRYKFGVGQKILDLKNDTKQALDYSTGIYDWSGKVNFDYMPGPDHYVRFGGLYTYHRFSTGALQYATNGFERDTSAKIGNPEIYAHEINVYAEDDWSMTSRLKVNLGVHGAGCWVQHHFYQSLQPRVSSRYVFDNNWSVKASYANMTQFIHLLANSNVGLPTDLWVPVTKRVKPQQAWQGAVGVAKSIKNNTYELSVEGYYKEMKNILDYLDGAEFLGASSDWEDKVAQGKGWSYGVEVLLQKKKGKYSGWVGYTLSWTNRQFAPINFGKVYPYKYDRRHDLSVVNLYKISNRLDLALTWVYGTGSAITMPLQSYVSAQVPGLTSPDVQYYGGKNNYRMAAYHRLDFSLNLHKKKRWGKSSWSFGAYNLYSRQNPYFLYFSTNAYGTRQLKQVSLFRIIPAISWSFKFDFRNFKTFFEDDEELEEFDRLNEK